MKKSFESKERRGKYRKRLKLEGDTLGTRILEIFTPLPNKNISGDENELDDFTHRHVSKYLISKSNNKNNVNIHVCQQLHFSQEEQIESQREYICFSRKELESKERVLIIFQKL